VSDFYLDGIEPQNLDVAASKISEYNRVLIHAGNGKFFLTPFSVVTSKLEFWRSRLTKKPSSSKDISDIIAILPLSGALLLPQTHRPLMIFEPRYLSLLEDIIAGDRIIGIVQPLDNKEESPLARNTPLHKVGCLGYLQEFEKYEDNKYIVVLEGLCRFDVLKEIDVPTPYRQSRVNYLPYIGDFDPQFGADQINREEFLTSMDEYSKFANFSFDWEGIKSMPTSMLINMCCVLAPYGAKEKQALLEASSIYHRAQTLIALSELEIGSASGSIIQ